MIVGSGGVPNRVEGGGGGGFWPRKTLPKAWKGEGKGAPVTGFTGPDGWTWARAGGAKARKASRNGRLMGRKRAKAGRSPPWFLGPGPLYGAPRKKRPGKGEKNDGFP